MFDEDEAWALVEAGLEATRMKPLRQIDGEAGWYGNPGELHYGCDTDLGGGWVTAEQAAAEFNLTVREIEERYRPAMLALYPGSVLEPLTEVRYEYDFEAPGFTWEGYSPRSLFTTDPHGHKFDYYPERPEGIDPEDMVADPSFPFTIDSVDGYDKGLEPRSRTVTTQVRPRLFELGALTEVRLRRVASRKVKPIPPRGKGGKFVKAAA